MKKCVIEDCSKKHYAMGMCRNHYQKWKYHNPKQFAKVKSDYSRQSKVCSVEGCNHKPKAKNLCDKHYARKSVGKPLKDNPFEDLPGETWKKLEDMPYEASNMGRIRRTANSAGNTRARLLSPRDTGRYLQVALYKNGVRSEFQVHQLIAKAFYGDPPDEKSEVDHLDGNGKNNQLSNLEYVSRSENVLRSYKGRRKLSEADVREIRTRLDSGETQRSLAQHFGVAQATISKIGLGQRRNHVVEIT